MKSEFIEVPFTHPSGVALDSSGNVYVADSGNHTIRKITSAGVVTTLAGTAGTSGSANGTGVAASFNGPESVTTDSAGNVYVADTYNNTIRKITAAGAVTTGRGRRVSSAPSTAPVRQQAFDIRRASPPTARAMSMWPTPLTTSSARSLRRELPPPGPEE